MVESWNEREIWGGPSTDPVWGIVGNQYLIDVHSQSLCEGEWCVFHNPSDHHMRQWPTLWRDDRKIMERICPHGVGHPDPDDVAYHIRNDRAWQGVHGCDGCCRED